jgi:hypothetical protein
VLLDFAEGQVRDNWFQYGKSVENQGTLPVQAVEAAGSPSKELDGGQSDSGGVKPVGRDALRQQTQAGLRIRFHFIRIRIQHFRMNTDPDPGL